MTRKPLVSVLLPYRKKDVFFTLALKSLEKQTYSRIEILTFEDAKAEGITVLLNRLAHRARGEFLARMDADDVSEPTRIEKQVEFMKLNPDVMVVGTWATLIDEKGRKIGIQKMPIGWEKIKHQAFVRNPLIHPSWMMRKKWFDEIGGYNLNFKYSQDWELVLRRVWLDKIENIPESLLKLRIHKYSSSFAKNKEQIWYGIKARVGAIRMGYIPFWRIIHILPSLFSLIVPTNIKYLYRKGI